MECAKSAGLLLHVSVGVREQRNIICEIEILQGREEGPPDTLGWTSVVRRITQSMAILKRNADITYACRTPDLTSKLMSPFPTLQVKL